MKQLASLVFILFIGAAFYNVSAKPINTASGTKENHAKVQDSTKVKKATTKNDEDIGIGPIKELKLGPINKKLAEKGESIFDARCMSCHRLDSRLVGPALEGVTDIRSPEWIMNFMLNSTVMEAKDPAAKALLDKYHIPMIVPGITKSDARAVLEYLRSVDAKK